MLKGDSDKRRSCLVQAENSQCFNTCFTATGPVNASVAKSIIETTWVKRQEIGLNNKMCTLPDVLRAKKIRLMCTQMMPKQISNVGCFHIMKSFSGSFSLQQVFFPSMYHQDDRSVELVKLATALGDLTGIVSVRL
jgi:hypothetical protein